VGHVPRPAVDADEIVAQPHYQQRGPEIYPVDQGIDLEVQVLPDLLKRLFFKSAAADKDELVVAEFVDLLQQFYPPGVLP
jgi:hypothetical protein